MGRHRKFGKFPHAKEFKPLKMAKVNTKHQNKILDFGDKLDQLLAMTPKHTLLESVNKLTMIPKISNGNKHALSLHPCTQIFDAETQNSGAHTIAEYPAQREYAESEILWRTRKSVDKIFAAMSDYSDEQADMIAESPPLFLDDQECDKPNELHKEKTTIIPPFCEDDVCGLLESQYYAPMPLGWKVQQVVQNLTFADSVDDVVDCGCQLPIIELGNSPVEHDV